MLTKSVRDGNDARGSLAEAIEQGIHLLRSQRVMLSSTFAALYDVEPRALIQAVRRNASCFPKGFIIPAQRTGVPKFEITDCDFK